MTTTKKKRPRGPRQAKPKAVAPQGPTRSAPERVAATPAAAEVNPQDVLRIIAKHKDRRGELIATLEDIQAKYRHLPAKALRIVADQTRRSLADVYGVATFYKLFSLTPRGKHFVSVCLGTACHVRGAPTIAAEFERQLGVAGGGTTPDGEFTLETVNCLGGCALGPIAVIDGRFFLHVRQREVPKILAQVREGLDGMDFAKDVRVFPIEVRCPRCNHRLMDAAHPIDNHPSVRLTASSGTNHGWIRLSSLYGSYNCDSEYEISNDTVAQFFCPHCHAHLVGTTNCAECDAPTVPMIVSGGGMVQICSRRGCKSHILDLAGDGVE